MFFLQLYHKLLFRVSRKAIFIDESRLQLKIAIVATNICIIGAAAEFIFTLLDLFQGKWINMSFNFLGTIIFILAINLFTKGYFFLVRILIVYVTIAILAINASAEGRDAGNQFLLIPVIAGSIILFPRKEFKYSVLCIIPAVLVFIFLEYTSYSYLLLPGVDTSLLYVNYLFCFILSVLLVYLFIYYLNAINSNWELKLDKLNKLLKEKNKKLKKANQELDSYVYKTTHDLRAPLTSLMGLFELIKTEKNQQVVNEYLLLSEKSVYKMDVFIKDILTLSKNSKLELSVEKISFLTIIDEIYLQLNYLNRSYNIEKEFKVVGDGFYSDSKRINVLLSNLITNSILYSDSSKEEKIIKVDVYININECTIHIWDNGIGIGQKHLSNVFGMFYRATDRTQGSGLGLYIVKDTVEKLGGRVSLQSMERKWTEFVIVLPNLKST